MKPLRIFTAILLVCAIRVQAGEIIYKVSDISPELTENARSVVRFSSFELEVTSIDRATLKVTRVITVLNKNGINDANLVEYYDKFRSISSIKGRVCDENGKLIKRFSSEDIEDFSAISGYSLYEDNRVKYIDPGIRQVPFTVEYSFEVNFNGILAFPTWTPVEDFNISVEKSVCKVSILKAAGLKYLELNMPAKVILNSDEKSDFYQWEITNFKALKREPLMPSFRDYFPMVLLNPLDFEIGGYKGSSASWASLGDWTFSLIEGKDVLLPETVAELKELVKDCATQQEKVCKIYGYMQGRVRYVNLAIDLGGWQPIDAATVHRLGYGDCKALSNYMKAMLKAVGIESYYCRVYAGENVPDIIPSFPAPQFNHIILCVPFGQDTTWLECTSQHNPCGYLGGFTENRYALLVDKSNSRLVRTNERRKDENVRHCNASITFDETGKGNIRIETMYSGTSYDDILPVYLADDTEKKKMISENLSFPSFNLQDYSFNEIRSTNPAIQESILVGFENYLTVMNSKYLLPLNCTNKITNSPPTSRNRKCDVVIRHDFIESDSIIFNVPDYFDIESIPDPVMIETDFGTYSSQVIRSENNLIYIRRLSISKGVHPASAYNSLLEFYDGIIMADDEKCVLVKKM